MTAGGADDFNAGKRFGGPDRDRTGDLLNAIQARSQLRYRPLGEPPIIPPPRPLSKSAVFLPSFGAKPQNEPERRWRYCVWCVTLPELPVKLVLPP